MKLNGITDTAIRAVVFDAFGTLVRYPVKHHPYNLLRGRNQEEAAFRRQCMTVNLNAAALAAANGRTNKQAEFGLLLAEERRHIVLYPEVPALLNDLQRRGIRPAVCSNLAYEYGGILRRLLPAVLDLVLSYEAGAVKPETAIYAAVEAKLGLPRRQILFVGDNRRNDAAAPAAYSFQSVWLQRPQQDLRGVLAGYLEL